MFALKQAVGLLVMPLTFAVTLAVLGLLCRAMNARRASRIVLIAAGSVALAAALGPVGDLLLQPLEHRYTAVLDASKLSSSPRYIAVLGGGYRPQHDLPVTAALNPVALVRLIEAVRLWRQLPGAKLIVSGGPGPNTPPSARGYAIAAMSLGVPSDSIVVVDTPLDTGTEIRELSKLLGGESVILVTSASHMPRAMAHCERLQLQAIPAPTGQLANSLGSWGLMSLLPSGLALRKTETALHEYVGLLALGVGIT